MKYPKVNLKNGKYSYPDRNGKLMQWDALGLQAGTSNRGTRAYPDSIRSTFFEVDLFELIPSPKALLEETGAGESKHAKRLLDRLASHAKPKLTARWIPPAQINLPIWSGCRCPNESFCVVLSDGQVCFLQLYRGKQPIALPVEERADSVAPP